MCRVPSSDFLEFGALIVCTVGLWFASTRNSDVLVNAGPSPSTDRCRTCDYDVRGLPLDQEARGTCPECGTPFTHDNRNWMIHCVQTHLQPRGLVALGLILSTLWLPIAITRGSAFLLDGFAPRLARGIANSYRGPFWAHHNGPQIVIGGVACAMAAAMILSYRASLAAFLTRVLLAAVAYLAVYIAYLPANAFASGDIWNTPLHRENTPVIGSCVGFAIAGTLMSWSAIRRAWRQPRVAPTQPEIITIPNFPAANRA